MTSSSSMYRAAALGLMIAIASACGGESSVEPDAPGFTPPPFVPGPNEVHLQVSGDDPIYIRYRDGDGPWTQPARRQDYTYALFVTDAYDVVVLCGGMYTFDAEMLKRTYRDGAEASVYCQSFSFAAAPSPVEVGGTMAQPGEVFMSDYATSTSGPWHYALFVEPDTYDLIAASADHIAIRRDVEVTASTTLPPLDVDQEGQPLSLAPFIVDANRDVETVRADIVLETHAGFALLDATPTSLRIPPASLLMPDDTISVSITASTDHTDRSVSTADPNAYAYTLPAALSGIEFSYPYRQLWATWHDLPRYTELTLTAYGLTAPTTQGVSASASYLEATHTAYLSFYPAPPDYDPRFNVDLVSPYERSFSASDASQPDAYRWTEYYEDVNFP